jgi:hypothetical protein
MPLHDMRQLIGASAELGSLRHEARKLAQLQQVYVDNFPVEFAELTRTSRVGYIKGSALYVLADDAATAAKLRHLAPRLAPLLSKLGPKVSGIRIVVQVKSPYTSPLDSIRKNSLPIDSIEHFSKLADQVKNPNLKSALNNLVKKRRGPAP